MSLASVAAQQSQTTALLQAANSSAAGTSGASTVAGAASTTASAAPNALASLSGNFQDFLKLLMTQLQNQNPASPLDTNQFTSQLVQFASVGQQINANQSLTQLIQLTQSGEILQSSSMLGHQVAVQSDHMPLQNGTGQLQFTAASAGPVAIAVYSDNGTQLADATVQAVAGNNTWTWDGTTGSGSKAPDGAYRVAVMGLDQSGNPVAQPFSVVGTATGVATQNGTLQLQLGPEAVPFGSVQSILT